MEWQRWPADLEFQVWSEKIQLGMTVCLVPLGFG
jgi:hypothetical protein